MIRFYGIMFVFINIVFLVEVSGKYNRKNNGNYNGNNNGGNGNNRNNNGNKNGINGINGQKHRLPPMLPDSFKDVFVDTPGGKKTLGTTKATCWARGGLCMDIRDCPNFNIDISVPGCAWGYKVCCKVNKLAKPTVGQFRKTVPKAIQTFEDLGGVSLESMAMKNTVLLKTVLGFQT